jgi:hypothetical protein
VIPLWFHSELLASVMGLGCQSRAERGNPEGVRGGVEDNSQPFRPTLLGLLRPDMLRVVKLCHYLSA